jgi:methionyl-tRNA formyltransferase
LKLDTGPVLATAAAPILDEDNTGSLTEKLGIIGAGLLDEALTGWLKGTLKPVNQDETRATYFGQVKKGDGKIDWKLPALEIWRRVRAFYPWPGCFTFWKGKQLKINKAAVFSGGDKSGPGSVVALPGVQGGVGIATGEGILVMSNVQYEGKKAMNAPEFLRGQRDFIGSRLPS